MRWPSTIGFALVALGGTYAVLFVAEGTHLDHVAPAYAAGLLLVAELAFWSIESRVPAWTDPEVVIWRLARLALACVGAAVLGAIVVADAAAAGGGGGLLLETLGCRRGDRCAHPRDRAPAPARRRVLSRLVRNGL